MTPEDIVVRDARIVTKGPWRITCESSYYAILQPLIGDYPPMTINVRYIDELIEALQRAKEEMASYDR